MSILSATIAEGVLSLLKLDTKNFFVLGRDGEIIARSLGLYKGRNVQYVTGLNRKACKNMHKEDTFMQNAWIQKISSVNDACIVDTGYAGSIKGMLEERNISIPWVHLTGDERALDRGIHLIGCDRDNTLLLEHLPKNVVNDDNGKLVHVPENDAIHNHLMDVLGFLVHQKISKELAQVRILPSQTTYQSTKECKYQRYLVKKAYRIAKSKNVLPVVVNQLSQWLEKED